MFEITEKSFPVLYQFVRHDMDSMNPGKGHAQGGHAISVFHETMHEEPLVSDAYWSRLFAMWKNQSSSTKFGTKLCIGVNLRELREIVTVAQHLGLVAGIAHDDEYPLMDGETLHLIPLDTAGFVFGDKEGAVLRAITRHYNLHA